MAYFNKLGTVAWAEEIMAMINRIEAEGVKLNMRERIELNQAVRILGACRKCFDCDEGAQLCPMNCGPAA